MKSIILMCVIFGGQGKIDQKCVEEMRLCVAMAYKLGTGQSIDVIAETLLVTNKAERIKFCESIKPLFTINKED
jgi:hypothetical protein